MSLVTANDKSFTNLDHEKKPNAIVAGGEVAFEIINAKGQRLCEDLVKSVLGLTLRRSREKG